jgi:hypothetical protein
VAQIGEVGAQLDITERGCGELLLERCHGHNWAMGVMKVDTGFIRPDPARTLHKHAGDNLEVVGDPVLKLLQQDAPLADKVVLDLLGHARVGHVGDRQEETDTVRIAVVKLVSVKHETADTLARLL